MEQKQYDYFYFNPNWWSYLESQLSSEQSAHDILEIAQYGLDQLPPTDLHPISEAYFNDVIKPELDAQHRAFDRKERAQKRREERTRAKRSCNH